LANHPNPISKGSAVVSFDDVFRADKFIHRIFFRILN
jgi:hypothetical protein